MAERDEKELQAEYQALRSQISQSLGYQVRRTDFEISRMGTRAERLAEIRNNGCAMPVGTWAKRLSEAIAERAGWSETNDEHKRQAAALQFAQLFASRASTLPLRKPPAWLLTRGQPLPERWEACMWMDKNELREWASQHAPDLLDLDLLAETASSSAKGADIAPPPKPVQRRIAQEEAVLAKLVELGYKPSALPFCSGKPSAAKNQAKDGLTYTEAVFNKTWQRLRADGRIRNT